MQAGRQEEAEAGGARAVRAGGAWRAGLAVALYLLAGTALAAACSTALVRAVRGHETAFARLVLLKGPAKVTVRFMQLFALALLPPLLRMLGWGGRRDIGWRAEGPPAGPAWREAAAGAALGLATLAPLAALQVAAGLRTGPVLSWGEAARAALAFLPAAALVALVEETLARGIFYRTLARRWTAVPAALVLSAFFAYLHFLRPEDAAFEAEGWWRATLAVFRTTFTSGPAMPGFAVRMATLGLMSLALCAMVARRGTVWLAVGAHAGWVWCLRVNARVTDAVWSEPVTAWLRHRPDLTDSAAAAAMLAALLAVLLLRRRRA